MINLPKFNSKKEAQDYVRANKKRLIAEKTSLKYRTSAPKAKYTIKKATDRYTKASVNALDTPSEVGGELEIDLIGNTFNWADDQLDVLFSGCATKTIKEWGPKAADIIYHLKNHTQDTDGRVGYLSDIYEEQFSLADLGLNMVGSTICLVFSSLVKEDLDCKTYTQYKDKKVKQHSIGLGYVKIILCVDDPNDGEHFGNWNKYYQYVLNKDVVNSTGYFWAVTEIKLYEVSAVLWGSNELTPTLGKDNEPSADDTQKDEPQKRTQKSKSFYLSL